MTPSSALSLIYVTFEDGKVFTMDHDDVTSLIYKTLKLSGISNRLLSLNLADTVLSRLNRWNGSQARLTIADVETMIKFVLKENGFHEAATLTSEAFAPQVA
jgi:hypothetical protein